MPDRDLTDSQRHLLSQLSDSRCANLFQLADLIGDMNSDGLEFLRRLGDPRYEAMTEFLASAKPETLEFLTETRPEEIENLKDGLRLVVSLQLLGRVGKWFVITFLGTALTAMATWNTIAAWFKAR